MLNLMYIDSYRLKMFKIVAWILATLLTSIQPLRSHPVQTDALNGTHQSIECPPTLSLKVKIDKHNHQITVNLVESSRDFLHSYERNSGKGGVRAACFYQGNVENNEKGIAMARLRLARISGTFYYTNQVYQIPEQPSPTAEKPDDAPTLTARLVPDSSQKIRTCGVEDKARQIRNQSTASPATSDGRSARQIKIDTHYNRTDLPKRFIKLILVGDNAFFKNMGNDKDKAQNRLWDIANYVNALYKQFSVTVITVYTEIWDSGDPFTLNSLNDAGGINVKELLELFLKYRMENFASKPAHSAAHLISSLKFPNIQVGLANTGILCSFSQSGGVNNDKDTMDDVYPVAVTVAHELGHNLGLEHDDEANCKCPNNNKCVMAAVSDGKSPLQFSDCSVASFLDLANNGIGYCMTDPPQDSDVAASKPKSSCGNKFVEAGEDCDCGPAMWCSNNCCDPKTCKFKSGASCASGECCDLSTCALKPKATLCRAQKGICDLPETCNGASEWCPEIDDFKADGTVCLPGKAYCYKSRCDDRDSRCKALWADPGISAAPASWSVVTTQSNSNVGYCSYKEDRIQPLKYLFTACTTENQRCGVLYCAGGNPNSFSTKWKGAFHLAAFSRINKDLNINGARVARLDLKLSGYKDPGMVPNGAECGEKMMCVDSECVSAAPKISCPSCNGHGVCTQGGLCYCDAGFAPPDCSKPGDGGSLTNPRPPTTKTSAQSLAGCSLTSSMLLIVVASQISMGGY